jgi:hypothetical protein
MIKWNDLGNKERLRIILRTKHLPTALAYATWEQLTQKEKDMINLVDWSKAVRP